MPFPTTHWSQLGSRLAGPEELTEIRRRAWESLAAAYWRPVYAYVRARWARTDEDALDAAQEFFLHVFEGELLQRAHPARGPFRAFVKVSLANFIRDLERKKRALKRGGERTLLSLSGPGGATGATAATGSGEEPALDLPDTAGQSPDQALDDTWRRELLERAASTLERELASQGKERAFGIFRDYFLSDEELDYAAVAERYGVKSSDVSNDLQLAKKRYRTVLRAVVADTVADAGELEEELAWLFGREDGA